MPTEIAGERKGGEEALGRGSALCPEDQIKVLVCYVHDINVKLGEDPLREPKLDVG